MEDIKESRQLVLRQRRELAEVFGFETRNKYEILNESQTLIGFCAEQQKGIFGFLIRQFLGHWRSFEIHFFDAQKRPFMIARHPFRWFFQELHITNGQMQVLGYMKQRFGILRKKFDVHDAQDRLLFEMRSGLFQIWTFPFFRNGREVAVVKKKWSGFMKEVFLDADNFMVEFSDPNLTLQERQLILASSVFVDLQYFEKKAQS